MGNCLIIPSLKMNVNVLVSKKSLGIQIFHDLYIMRKGFRRSIMDIDFLHPRTDAFVTPKIHIITLTCTP